MKKRIVFFHLLNDYSGSPNILSLIIKGLIARGYEVDLHTSAKRNGFLSGIKGVRYHNIHYSFTEHRLKTLIVFIGAQIVSFLEVFRYCFNKDVVIYINTIYPFGAAIGAAITGKKLLYHVHEKPVKQNILTAFALYVIKHFAHKIIFVSEYLYNQYPFNEAKKVIVRNSISQEFLLKARKSKITDIPNNVLMVCSLRLYKGVSVFCKIAEHLPQYRFTLVLNSTDKEIKTFFRGRTLAGNIEIFPSQTDIHPFYSRAHLLLNLSIPDLWIESFGLTALEALSYGIPVIVPPVGGIAELVEDGVQGYKVNSGNIPLLESRICQIFSDKKLYSELSENARLKSESFSFDSMISRIESVVNSL